MGLVPTDTSAKSTSTQHRRRDGSADGRGDLTVGACRTATAGGRLPNRLQAGSYGKPQSRWKTRPCSRIEGRQTECFRCHAIAWLPPFVSWFFAERACSFLSPAPSPRSFGNRNG